MPPKKKQWALVLTHERDGAACVFLVPDNMGSDDYEAAAMLASYEYQQDLVLTPVESVASPEELYAAVLRVNKKKGRRTP